MGPSEHPCFSCFDCFESPEDPSFFEMDFLSSLASSLKRERLESSLGSDFWEFDSCGEGFEFSAEMLLWIC